MERGRWQRKNRGMRGTEEEATAVKNKCLCVHPSGSQGWKDALMRTHLMTPLSNSKNPDIPSLDSVHLSATLQRQHQDFQETLVHLQVLQTTGCDYHYKHIMAVVC